MPDGVDRVLSAKTERALLDASADDEGMTLPDGRRLSHADPEADAVLSEWLGKPVHLARAADQSGKTLSYAMTFDPPNDDADLFDIPLADGSFLDLAHVHLVTTATLSGCADAYPDLNWDVRRFRPNLLLDVDGPTFVEQEWIGRHVQVGNAVLEVTMPTVRCAMPLRAQPGGLDRQPGLFKAMNELNQVSPKLARSAWHSATVVQRRMASAGEKPPARRPGELAGRRGSGLTAGSVSEWVMWRHRAARGGPCR